MISGCWYFPVKIIGDLAFGGPVEISLGIPDKLHSDTSYLSKVSYCVESFIELANTGALGSSVLDPSKTKAILRDVEPFRSDRFTIWKVDEMCIDARGSIVLFNMLEYLIKDITEVQIISGGITISQPVTQDNPIDKWPGIPFSVNIEPDDISTEVEIEFLKSIPDGLKDVITDSVQVWMDCGTISGYKDSPDNFSCLSPADINIDGNMLNVQFEAINIPEMAYDILLNLLTKLSAVAPVKKVDIM